MPDAHARGTDRVAEVRGEPRLPDPGRPEDRHQVRAAALAEATLHREEELELLVATDQHTRARERTHRHGRGQSAGRPRPHPTDALGVELARLRVRHRRRGKRVGQVADEDLAGDGGLPDARGRVHGLPGHQELVAVAAAHDLAGVQPDAQLERGRAAAHGARSDLRADRERRANGTLGVILVRDRRAEDGHDLIADEFLDDAAVRFDDLAEGREGPEQGGPHDLRIVVTNERRRPHDVGEQHGDQTPLLPHGVGV